MGSTTRADIELLHGNLTGQIIGAFFDVYNELGHGFSELVYHRAVVVALTERGIRTETERALTLLNYLKATNHRRNPWEAVAVTLSRIPCVMRSGPRQHAQP